MNRFHISLKIRRDEYKPEVVRLYGCGIGHKTIAKQMGISPRLCRKILIEAGEYKPGSLLGGVNHRSALREASQNYIARTSTKREEWARYCKYMRCMEARRQSFLKVRAPRKQRAKRTFKERYHQDPMFRLYQLLRSRMKKVIVRGMKSGSSLELVGCSTEQVRAHLEAQFVKGMRWDNLGVGRGKWNIEHKIPCAAFDLTDPKQQRSCFHFTNLRPMWSIQNIRKGCKIDKHRTLSLPLNYHP